MDARYYLTCLWPGMAELWWRGRVAALPAAIAFTVAINLGLVTRFLYPEWLSGILVRVACWVGLIAWGVWVVRSVKELPELIAPRTVSEDPDVFPEARAAYMAGNWHEAEGMLSDVLAVEPRDPPALLLLAGVYRHTGRFDAAEQLLEQIARVEAADGWWLERESEQRRLERAREAAGEKEDADEEDADESGSVEEAEPADEPSPIREPSPTGQTMPNDRSSRVDDSSPIDGPTSTSDGPTLTGKSRRDTEPGGQNRESENDVDRLFAGQSWT